MKKAGVYFQYNTSYIFLQKSGGLPFLSQV